MHLSNVPLSATFTLDIYTKYHALRFRRDPFKFIGRIEDHAVQSFSNGGEYIVSFDWASD